MTNLQSGVIKVSKIGDSGVAGNLGANGTLNIGATTSAATLLYSGTGETNNRVINLAGTTGGATIEQAGTGLLKFSSALTATGAGAKTLTIQGSTAGTGELAGAIINSTAATSVAKAGTGTWTLSGANTYTGTTRVKGGVLNQTGTLTGGSTIIAADTASTNAVLNISNNISALNIWAGDANTAGAIYQTGGTLTMTQAASIDNLRVGSAASGRGYYKLSGGSLTVNEAGIGASLTGTVGVMDVTNGTLTDNGYLTIARGPSSTGILSITGTGALVMGGTGPIGLMWNASGVAGYGVLNVNSGGTVTGNNSVLDYAPFSGASTVQTGIVNIGSNGTFQIKGVQRSGGGGTSLLNFTGGKLKASPTNNGTSFFTNSLTGAYVFSGGGTIDNNGTNITVAQGLSAPSGNGVASIAVTDGGSGYIGAPAVVISGGTGSGASAVANMIDDGTGKGTYKIGSITITSPGNYSIDPTTITLSLAGASTAATLGAITTAANTSGNMAFTGSGITTLTGTSTYTGATNVTSGTLALSGTANLDATSGINVNGATARFLHVGTVQHNGPVNLTNGKVDGTGVIDNVIVGNGTGGVVSNGNGGSGSLYINNLTFNGAATLNLTVADAFSQPLVTSTLTTNAAGPVTVNASSPTWMNGQTYDLVAYSNLAGAGYPAFTLGTVSGLGARQTAVLQNSGASVQLVVSGDNPTWSGALSSEWSTAVLASPKNWKSVNLGSATDFLANDAVIFGDDATGTTSVNIVGANVLPSSVTFQNNNYPYTIGSTGGFGIAGTGVLIKSGVNALTLNSANTYSGGTTLNDGELHINNASAIGTGTLTFNTGNFDNTSGAAIALSTNNAQVWNSDLNFIGSNSLDLGTGNVTVNNSPGETIMVGNSATLSVGGSIAGSGVALLKGGTGTLTLGGAASTYTGGLYFNSGSLNINGAGALGTGTFHISGGTVIDNTSAGAVTLTTNNTATWDNDFTFVGTQSLNFGTGVVALGGSGSRTVNVTANTLTAGSVTGAGGLVKTGLGTIGFGAGGISTIGGALDVQGGKVQIGINDFKANGLLGSGTVENGSATTRWLFVTNATDNLFTGILQDGAGAGKLGLSKAGAGTLTLSGANSLGDLLTAGGGVVNVTGSMNLTRTTAPSVQAVNGAVRVGSGASLTTTSELWLANADGNYGALTIDGGNVTIGSWMAFGRGGGNGVLNHNNGTLNVTTNNLSLGSTGGSTVAGVLHGVATLSGSSVTNTTNNVYVGENTSGVLTMMDDATLNANGTLGVQIGKQNGTLSYGVVNLNGGVMSTTIVSPGTGTSLFNFNGGILQAKAAQASFMTGLGKANVYSGGAIIDTNGVAITVGQALLAPTGSGVSASGLVVSGSGYYAPPVVQITGGGGSGATAIASIDSSGNLTGITITNPGTDYTTSPTFTLVGGGGTGSVSGSASIVANTSGGLTVYGAGTLTLPAANSYDGVTHIGSSLTTNVTTVVATNNTSLGAATGGTVLHGVANGTGFGSTLQLGNGLNVAAGESLTFSTGDSTQRASVTVGGTDGCRGVEWPGGALRRWSRPVLCERQRWRQPHAQRQHLGCRWKRFRAPWRRHDRRRRHRQWHDRDRHDQSVENRQHTSTINSTGNTWGNTNIAQGTIKLGVNNALPATTGLTLGQAATTAILDLNGKNQTVTGIAGVAGSTAISVTSATAATFTVNNALAQSYGVNGGIFSGAISLVKTGAGTLTLGAANTYTGDTTVSGGILSITPNAGVTPNFADAADVKLTSGGVLDLNFTGTDTIDGFYIDGVGTGRRHLGCDGFDCGQPEFPDHRHRYPEHHHRRHRWRWKRLRYLGVVQGPDQRQQWQGGQSGQRWPEQPRRVCLRWQSALGCP
ncbi:MAG: autotransporter-associated beta strand repeat-containing protein [Luteolibacter sp.]